VARAVAAHEQEIGSRHFGAIDEVVHRVDVAAAGGAAPAIASSGFEIERRALTSAS
jgi:hypothetical protein